MYQWIKNHIASLSIIFAVIIACFPQLFTHIGGILTKYWAIYWLPGLLLIIVVLLIVILATLSKNNRPAP